MILITWRVDLYNLNTGKTTSSYYNFAWSTESYLGYYTELFLCVCVRAQLGFLSCLNLYPFILFLFFLHSCCSYLSKIKLLKEIGGYFYSVILIMFQVYNHLKKCIYIYRNNSTSLRARGKKKRDWLTLNNMRIILQKEVIQILGDKSRHAGICQSWKN